MYKPTSASGELEKALVKTLNYAISCM